MLPDSPVLLVLGVISYTLIGMGIGILSGRLTAIIVNRSWKECFRLGRVCWDALAGSVGLVGTVIILSLLPWRNTIFYDLPGGVHVTSTMSRYQYPFHIAYPVAFILPVLLELDRFRLSRRLR
jgi:hypothetical protein